MSTDAELRVTMASGTVYDDPSEDALFMLVEDIERGDEQFLIVERLSDASGQTYAQTIQNDSGGWLVERRDGSPEEHYRINVADGRTAHQLLTAWAFELPSSAAWTRVTA